MRRDEFLSAAADRLRILPKEDAGKILDYFREMIEDRMEEGLDEETAVAALGSPEEAAARVLGEMPVPALVKARLRSQRPLGGWTTALLILGSPVWLPLLLAVTATVAMLYLTLWMLVLSLYLITAGFAISGIASLLGSAVQFFAVTPVSGLFVLGLGLVMTGLSVPLFMASNSSAAGSARLGALALRVFKRALIGKGAKA